MNKLSLSLLCLPLLALASKNEDMMKSDLATAKVKAPLINELVEIKPIANHHFNLEAPNNCGDKGTMKPTARRIQCQFHESGSHSAMVSVCDNEKKYCKQQTLEFTVQKGSSETPRLEKSKLPKTAEMQKEMKKKLMPGFKALKPDEAKSALKGKKGAIVMVSTEWCPPCNLMKEFLLPTKQWQEMTSDYQLVYVDGDSPLMNDWRPLVGDPAYPTLVVMNPELEVIDLKPGYYRVDEMKPWLARAEAHLSDPISEVKSRVDERLEGSFKRKILDLITSKDDIKMDTTRLLENFDHRMKFVDLVTYLNKLQPENFEARVLIAKYENVLYGDEAFLQETEMEKPEFLKSVGEKILTTKGTDEHWTYSYLLEQECTPQPEMENNKKAKDGETKEEKTPVVNCKSALTEAMAKNNREQEEVEKKALASEIQLASAFTASSNADLLELLGSKEQGKTLKKQCHEQFLGMGQHSPLGEKSRAARIFALNCMDPEATDSMELLISLSEDYPFDSTFHLALSKRYLKKKQFKKARAANEKALTYAYGDNWVKARMQEANILKAEGKTKQAKSTLLESLGEIQLDAADRRTQGWLTYLRAQLEQLDAPEKKAN